jgi:hypothetical protein
MLVPPGSVSAYAAALNDVLGDRTLRASLGRRAYAYSRGMIWSAVGAEYRRLLGQVAVDVRRDERAGALAAINV